MNPGLVIALDIIVLYCLLRGPVIRFVLGLAALVGGIVVGGSFGC